MVAVGPGQCSKVHRGLEQRADGTACIQCPIKPAAAALAPTNHGEHFSVINLQYHDRSLHFARWQLMGTFQIGQSVFERALGGVLNQRIQRGMNPQPLRLHNGRIKMALHLAAHVIKKG